MFFELNWIISDRTILIFKLRAYATVNCLKWNCFDIETVLKLYKIVWNRTDSLYKNVFGIK